MVYSFDEVYENANLSRAYGDNIYLVVKHSVDASGPFAVVQEMRSMGVPIPTNDPSIRQNFRHDPSMYHVDLVPLGLKKGGKRWNIRPLRWKSALGNTVWDGAPDTTEVFRVLPYGQRVRMIELWEQLQKNWTKNNATNYEAKYGNRGTIRYREALKKVNAFRQMKKRVAKDPLMKAALDSSLKFFVSAHGSIDSTRITPLKVPEGVVVVFVTTPGASAYGSNRNIVGITEKDAKRMLLGVQGNLYTAAYFEGDTMSEHTLEFTNARGKIGAGIWWLGRSTPTEFASWKQLRASSNNKNENHKRLSALVTYVQHFGTRENPAVLFIHACRSASNGLLTSDFIEHVERNQVARRRVTTSKVPQKPKILVQRGQLPFLTQTYRRKRAQGDKFVNYLRDAGIVDPEFR
jgi:hypothetical protein